MKTNNYTKHIAISLLGLWLVATAGMATAQDDITGVWEGELAVGSGAGIRVQFTIEQGTDGTYSAVLDAPDQPSLTNVPVTSIDLEENNLVMNVEAVSGLYEGSFSDGSFTGTWTQQGSALDLELSPYTEPTLSAEDFERIAGSWVGQLRPIPGGELELNIVFRFEQDEDGNYVAFLDSPDEGALGIPVDSVSVDGDEVEVEVNRVALRFMGQLEGETIEGQWNQGGRTLDLNMVKGEVEVEGLDLSEEAFARMEGPWHGSVGPLTVVFRFERNEDGLLLGFMDSPGQGASGIPISTVNLDGDRVAVLVNAADINFSGSLGADSMTGEWSQGGQVVPVAFDKGPYVPNSGLSAAAIEQLQGTWRGVVNETELIFHFTAPPGGGLNATLDVPSAGAVGLPVTGVALDGQALSFAILAINAAFAGDLDGNSASGDWTRMGVTNPLGLSRE